MTLKVFGFLSTRPSTRRRRFVYLRAYWRWKSRRGIGRPKISKDLRDLIRQMSAENVLWGAPRIHGELLKLGFTMA